MGTTTFSGPVRSIDGFIGNVTGNIVGDVIATNQALSGAGAVNLTDMMTSLTSTGAAQALTLADGVVGQIKIISHVVDGGSAVLTPTTRLGYATITFTNAGDTAMLIYTAAGWDIVSLNGATSA